MQRIEVFYTSLSRKFFLVSNDMQEILVYVISVPFPVSNYAWSHCSYIENPHLQIINIIVFQKVMEDTMAICPLFFSYFLL